MNTKRLLTSPGLRPFWLVVMLVVLWDLLIRAFKIPPYLIPNPLSVAKQLVAEWPMLWRETLPTLYATLGGFALSAVVGVPIAMWIAYSRVVESFVYPLLVFSQSIPKVAIAPLFVVWFGFGLESKIVIGGLISFFPMIVNVIEGLQSTDRRQIDMLRAAGANSWQVFRMVKIPNALPFIFVGLDIGIVLAVLGAIVGEFVGAQGGIGFMILQYNFQLETAKVFALIVVLSVTGIALHNVVRWLHRRTVFWIKPDDVVGA